VKALYVTDRASAGDARVRAVIAALRGVPEVSVQLREKGVDDTEYLARARECREALGDSNPLFVNRRFDVALACGADGVHLPEAGLPVARVRAGTPRGFRVGVSTHSAPAARDAIADGAHLVVIGPIFPTPSKTRYGSPLGPEILEGLPPASEHAAEVYAIGGITEEGLEALAPYRDRISGVAGIRLFQDAPDPRALAERIACR
jgi:thiamine-phosphate pyrophosphorylase